jgi:phage gp37-like protein
MITEIEQALIDALIDGVASLKTARGFHGDFEDLDQERLEELLVQFPAALVVYSGSDFTRAGHRRERRMTYAVLLADKSLRGERDDTMRHGLYSLMEAVRTALDGTTLDMTITPLEIQRERLLFHARAFSVYAQEYETRAND